MVTAPIDRIKLLYQIDSNQALRSEPQRDICVEREREREREIRASFAGVYTEVAGGEEATSTHLCGWTNDGVDTELMNDDDRGLRNRSGQGVGK